MWAAWILTIDFGKVLLQNTRTRTNLRKEGRKERFYAKIYSISCLFLKVTRHSTNNITIKTAHRNLNLEFTTADIHCDTSLWHVCATRFCVVSALLKVMAGPEMLKTLLYTVNNLLQQEKYKAALAVLKGFRNGAVWVKTSNKLAS